MHAHRLFLLFEPAKPVCNRFSAKGMRPIADALREWKPVVAHLTGLSLKVTGYFGARASQLATQEKPRRFSAATLF
jgi:hypothetical protein